MSESKPQWTPRPWKVWGLDRSPRIVTDYILAERQNQCKAIADTCLWDIMPNAEKRANGHLIAAAPDLYAELEDAAEEMEALAAPGQQGATKEFFAMKAARYRRALAKAREEKTNHD